MAPVSWAWVWVVALVWGLVPACHWPVWLVGWVPLSGVGHRGLASTLSGSRSTPAPGSLRGLGCGWACACLSPGFSGLGGGCGGLFVNCIVVVSIFIDFCGFV